MSWDNIAELQLDFSQISDPEMHFAYKSFEEELICHKFVDMRPALLDKHHYEPINAMHPQQVAEQQLARSSTLVKDFENIRIAGALFAKFGDVGGFLGDEFDRRVDVLAENLAENILNMCNRGTQ